MDNDFHVLMSIASLLTNAIKEKRTVFMYCGIRRPGCRLRLLIRELVSTGIHGKPLHSLQEALKYVNGSTVDFSLF